MKYRRIEKIKKYTLEKTLTIFLFLIFALFVSSCSSRQLMETSDKQDISIEEDRTDIELDRSKDLIQIIKSLEIDKAIKSYIIKEIEYKDRFLVLKDEKIKSLNSRIKAYQRESSKAVNKCEEKQEEFIDEQKKCLVDAGAGKVLWWFFGLVGAGLFVYLVYIILTKTNLKNLIMGGN